VPGVGPKQPGLIALCDGGRRAALGIGGHGSSPGARATLRGFAQRILNIRSVTRSTSFCVDSSTSPGIRCGGS
jgi:hypothetical protein